MNTNEKPILTKAEEEVLYLLTVEKLTPKQAANRRKCSYQAVYRIKKRLQEKGVLGAEFRNNSPQETEGGLPGNIYKANSESRTWDLHGCKWRVRILEGSSSPRYKRFLGQGVGVFRPRKGVSVECFESVIIVHSDKHWFGSSPEQVVEESWGWLFRVISRLESDLGLLLVKPRSSNVRRFAGHFACVDDPSGRVVAGGDSVVVLAADGKRRFVIDWSKGVVPEAEFVHSRLSQSDAVFYEGYVKDLLEQRVSLSEVLSLHSDLSVKHSELAQALKVTVEVQQGLVQVVESQARLLSVLLPKPGASVESDGEFADYFG